LHHSSSFHHRHHHHHRHNLPGQALDIAIREQMMTMIIMMMVMMMIIMMMTNHFSLQSWWASGSKACWVTNCWSVLTNQHIGSGCLGFSDTDSHNFSLVAQLSRPTNQHPGSAHLGLPTRIRIRGLSQQWWT
jgi:hypothetical protein